MKMGRFLALREHFRNEAPLPNVIFPIFFLMLLIIIANISICISDFSFTAHLRLLSGSSLLPTVHDEL